MGMASSQARLLSLTSRQLDVELRAQVLQARKLQLGNDSRRVYNNYIAALNESKLQYRFTNNMGEAVMKDATLNGLQNGMVGAYGTSDQVMFLQSIDGKTLFVTPTVNNAYNLTGVSNGDYPHLNAYLKDVLGAGFNNVLKIDETEVKTGEFLNVMEITNQYIQGKRSEGANFNFYKAIEYATDVPGVFESVKALALNTTETVKTVTVRNPDYKEPTYKDPSINDDPMDGYNDPLNPGNNNNNNGNTEFSPGFEGGGNVPPSITVYTRDINSSSIDNYIKLLESQLTKVTFSTLTEKNEVNDGVLKLGDGTTYELEELNIEEIGSNYIDFGHDVIENVRYYSTAFMAREDGIDGGEYYAVYTVNGVNKACKVDLPKVSTAESDGGVHYFIADDNRQGLDHLLGLDLIVDNIHEFYDKVSKSAVISALTNFGLKMDGKIYATPTESMREGYVYYNDLSDALKKDSAANGTVIGYYDDYDGMLTDEIVNELARGGLYHQAFEYSDVFNTGEMKMYNDNTLDPRFTSVLNPDCLEFSEDGSLQVKVAPGQIKSDGSYMVSSNRVADNIYNTLLIYAANSGSDIVVPKLDRIKEYLHGNTPVLDLNASSILFRLNQACDAYLHSARNQEDGKYNIKLSQMMQTKDLASEFACHLHTLSPDGELLYSQSLSIEDAKYREILGDTNSGIPADVVYALDFDKYFENLLNEINTETNVLGSYPPPAPKRDFTFEQVFNGALEIRPTSTVSEYFNGKIETNSGEDTYSIPDDYTLANNIYMALVNYSKENEDKADISYADAGVYERIYNKIQELENEDGSKNDYIRTHMQYIIENYAGYSKYGIGLDLIEDDMSILYDYFFNGINSLDRLSADTKPSKTEGIAISYKTKSENDENINSAVENNNISEIARSYFSHYAYRGFYSAQTREIVDTSNPNVQKAIAMYNLGQRYDIKVVNEELAASREYVTNMVQNAAGVLLTVDTSKVAATEYSYLVEDVIWNDKEAEKEKQLQAISSVITNLVDSYDVNVATNTYLEEITNNEKIAQAQATYEADMATINRKETKIDNQLTQLEAERTAIKSEQDTLKNVVKDNVNLTFKLFS